MGRVRDGGRDKQVKMMPTTHSKFPWTLEIEGLGPIKKASIQPAPLMLFVGDNGSGKTLLMSVLWGLTSWSWSRSLWDYRPLPTSFQVARQWLRDMWNQDLPYRRRLDANDLRIIFDFVNDLVAEKGPSYVRRLFNSPDLSLEVIRFVSKIVPGQVGIELQCDGDKWSRSADWRMRQEWTTEPEPCSVLTIDHFGEDLDDPGTIFHDVAMLEGILVHVLWQSALLPHYFPILPSARTGVLLLYKSALQFSAQQSFNSVAARDMPRLNLSQAHIEFMNWIGAEPMSLVGPFADEADRLESEALGGRIQVVSDPGRSNEFNFLPDGSTKPLQLHQSASMVTELAPLVLALRYRRDLKYLIIEEPEAHLNPKQILAVARCLARLVNRGVNVWITTHSDLLIEQFNNLIRVGHIRTQTPSADGLRAEPESTRDYTDSELLQVDDIAAYQFEYREGGVEVEQLTVTHSGIPTPNLTATTRKLAEEGYLLLEAMEPE